MRAALAEEKDEDPECTFHPKISEMSQKLVQKNRPDFIERNNMWLSQRDEKIKLIGDSKEDKELLHCTFKPQLRNISPPRKGKSEVRQHLGVDKFLERQKAARAERKRRNDILNGKKRGEKSSSSMAKKKMTIPKNPKLSAYQTTQKGRKIKGPIVKSNMTDRSKQEIEEMYRDQNAVYPSRVTLNEAIMTLHEHLNSFEIVFD